MKTIIKLIRKLNFLLLIILFITPILSQQANYRTHFMNYFNANINDVHNVIMKFHKDNPYMQGTVYCHLTWEKGNLINYSIDSNTTNNSSFAKALIEMFQSWTISRIQDKWQIVLPIKTFIVGSDQPEFNETGIFTGYVYNTLGVPIDEARLIFTSRDYPELTPDTLLTNPEGIFIKTLIKPGRWNVDFYHKDYESKTIRNMKFNKGQHIKENVRMSNRKRI